jgi:hypothetical protein
MKVEKKSRREKLGSAALRYTMLLALLGFALMVGVAVINTGG